MSRETRCWAGLPDECCIAGRLASSFLHYPSLLMHINSTHLVPYFAEWLSRYRWDHCVTLTTRNPCSEETLRRRFERQFVRRLEGRTGGFVSWFWAAERTYFGHSHIHALVGGTVALRGSDVARAWKGGFSRCGVLRSRDCAIAYVVKEIGNVSASVDGGSPDFNFDVSRRLLHPPSASHHCRSAPTFYGPTRARARTRGSTVDFGISLLESPDDAG